MEACKVSAALLLAAILLLGPASAAASSSYYPASERALFLVFFRVWFDLVWFLGAHWYRLAAEVVGGLLTSTATAVVKKLWSLSLKSTTSTRTGNLHGP
jgi:hypothetical protein